VRIVKVVDVVEEMDVEEDEVDLMVVVADEEDDMMEAEEGMMVHAEEGMMVDVEDNVMEVDLMVALLDPMVVVEVEAEGEDSGLQWQLLRLTLHSLFWLTSNWSLSF
jgi:hypothetical protein